MYFTSFNFFLFFPSVVLLFYLTPHRFRWLLLLLASSLFYSVFSWKFLLLLYITILVNYLLGLRIIDRDGKLKRPLYISGIIFNILVLCFFKYFNYLGINLRAAADFFHLYYPDTLINIIFPLGLSYFIFASLSYIIDVKRREVAPERHPGVFAACFLFFPKVIQGPIERSGKLIPQFHTRHEADPEGIKKGLLLMLWGFFKKMVIADNLAIFVNTVFSFEAGAQGPAALIGIILFGFQLYADFSGYTDIALGSAKVLGYDLTQNFRRPYLARSVRDFWTRWHITLSSWCTDYVFIPIVANTYGLKKLLQRSSYLAKVNAGRIMYVIAAFTTFLIIGVWHGVGWNYIVVGALFGFYVSFDMLTKKIRQTMNDRIGLTRFPIFFKNAEILTTFMLVTFVWIFFRTDSPATAGLLIKNLFHGWSFKEVGETYYFYSRLGLDGLQLLAGAGSLIILILWDVLSEKKDMFERIAGKPAILRWSFYYFLLISVIILSAPENQKFIYSQF